MYIIYQGHVNQDGKSSEPDNEGLGSNPRKQKWRRTVASLFLFASSKLSPSPCHRPPKKNKNISLQQACQTRPPTAVFAFSPRFPSSSAAQGQLLHQQRSPFTSSYPRVDKEEEKMNKENRKCPQLRGSTKTSPKFQRAAPKISIFTT